MSLPISDTDLGNMVSEIVAAYVANHTIAAADLPELIRSVRSALINLSSTPAEPEPAPEPAVPIKKSVFADYLVCLEDGVKLKMLKRHLSKTYNMTPEDYRKKWGLPNSYPMTAPAYAEQRSKLAKASGLGLRSKPEPEIADKAEPPVQRITEGPRGKKRTRVQDESEES